MFTSTSTVVFKTFACDKDVVGGKRYLRADYSISCDTGLHKFFEVYSGLMIAVSSPASTELAVGHVVPLLLVYAPSIIVVRRENRVDEQGFWGFKCIVLTEPANDKVTGKLWSIVGLLIHCRVVYLVYYPYLLSRWCIYQCCPIRAACEQGIQ